MFLKRRLFFIFLVLVLSLPATKALFHPGFFPSQDGEWMVIRLSAFHQELFSGQWPVRFASRLNHSFGYPVFNFLYPFPFYLGEFFYLFLGSFQSAVKAIFIFSFLGSGTLMYLWIRGKVGNLGGLVSALLYVYTPYRFLDVYVRGSVGEATAFIFPPVVFWAIERMKEKKKNLWFYLSVGALAYSALFASHNVMGLLFGLVFLGYGFFLFWPQKDRRLLINYGFLFFLSLGLGCFFWLPALGEKRYVYFDQVVVSDFFSHFPSWSQLILPRWGFGPSIPGAKDLMSFQVGLLNLTIVLFWLVIAGAVLIRRVKVRGKCFGSGPFFLAVFLSSFCLMLQTSAPIWRMVSVYHWVQFPWRLLGVACLATSALGGFLVSFLSGKVKGLVALGLMVGAVLLNVAYARPEFRVNRDEGFYITNEGTTTVADEYLPIWVKNPPLERAKEKVEIVSGKGKITDLALGFKRVRFNTESEESTVVKVNTVYFPGWQVLVDGKKVKINFAENNGLLVFDLASGPHSVEAVFRETRLRRWADFVSLVSLLLVASKIGAWLVGRKKRGK